MSDQKTETKKGKIENENSNAKPEQRDLKGISFIKAKFKSPEKSFLVYKSMEESLKLFATITRKKPTLDPENLQVRIGKIPLMNGYVYQFDIQTGNIVTFYSVADFTEGFEVTKPESDQDVKNV